MGNYKALKIGPNTFLYDVVEDPMERANLKTRMPDVYKRLTDAWMAWNAGMLPQEPGSFTYDNSGDEWSDHILTPALDGMKKEWREASQILGATNRQYWTMVALPILWPSLLGTTLLLFANAFGAIATAYALTGSSLNIVPMVLYAQIRGDVLHNANLGYAIALGMVVITGISNFLYIWLRIRAERWQK